MRSHRLLCLVCSVLAAAVCLGAAPAENDLDALMKQVVARRDEGWKKLQQYVFDEREQIEMRGTNRLPIWGEKREYTWFIRDGFFVRSPTKFNGVTIGEAERQKFEADFLKQAQARDKRAPGGDSVSDTPAAATDGDLAQDVGGVIRQTRTPQFISSAYFLRFKFEPGKYALVGRETLDGHDVLRIEHYPARLFTGTDRRRDRKKDASAEDKAHDEAIQRLMNKVALITIWVDPKAQQIVKYTFDNVNFEFLPAQWLVHIGEAKATMTVGQPFPDVFLPTSLAIDLGMTMAVGQIDMHYGLEYHGYRVPSVTSKVGIK